MWGGGYMYVYTCVCLCVHPLCRGATRADSYMVCSAHIESVVNQSGSALSKCVALHTAKVRAETRSGGCSYAATAGCKSAVDGECVQRQPCQNRMRPPLCLPQMDLGS